MEVIGNRLIFDEEGKLKEVTEPGVHTFSKPDFVTQRVVKPNLIVLGDVPSDAVMA